ncbi:MAG: T9SS type A sorting domain-containing protein [Bacteroidota bacterium]
MKKIYLFLIFTLSSLSLSATHIIGGSITYEHLGGDDYQIRLEVLRDCYNGIPWFDDPAAIGIFDDDGNLIEQLLVPLDAQSNDTISLAVPNSVCVYPPNICINKTVYLTTVTLPVLQGGYTLTYQRCCRSLAITNLLVPADAGMTFHTQVLPKDENTSPIFNNDVPVAVFVNTPFIYNGSATDVDGDSLVYELATPFNGATDILPMPQPPAPPPYDVVEFLSPTYSVDNMLSGNYPLTIDSQTGEMSAIPATLGVFQIGYSVKEYRNSQLIGTTYREFTFVVIPTTANQNYDVSGQVLINNNTPLDFGTVQILERDVLTDSLYFYDEQSIGPNAEYGFMDIPPGVFYIKAIVDPASVYFDNYLPTYYNSAAFWYEATPINQCDTSQLYRDINLLHVDSLTGMLVFNGLVINPNNNGEPVAGLNLLLGDENGEIVQARTTDEDGRFKFENLSIGTYELYADLINSSIDNSNPPSVDLQGDTNVEVFLFENFLSINPIFGDVDESIDEILEVHVFPNPVKENLTLQLNIKKADHYFIKIHNLLGQPLSTMADYLFLPTGIYTKEFNLSDISNGVYFIEIVSDEGQVVKKLIKR